MKRTEEKKGKRAEKLWKSPLLTAVLLIFLLIAGSFLAVRWVNRMEEERSFERLCEETSSLAQEIEDSMINDRQQLELLAIMASGYEDLTSKELWRVLASSDSVGMMSRLELLLPGDTVIRAGGERVDASGILSFEEEAEHGAHVSDQTPDLGEEGAPVVRNFVPVTRDGEIVAMLYGVIELGSLPEDMSVEPYSGQAAIYLIEGETGDFLIDTWHGGTGGNIWALGEREMAPGYDHEKLKQGLTDGEAGYVVFVSETTGDHLYFYFEPLAINEWRIALSVPADVVFENAYATRNILNLLLGFEIICFIVYFLWVLRYVRNVTAEKQRQLDTINFIYDVENLLFNAHENQENISQALEKIAEITSAEKTGFWLVDQSGISGCFLWSRNQEEMKDGDEAAAQKKVLHLLELFRSGREQIEAYDGETMKAVFPELPSGTEFPESLIAVPVKGMDGSVRGILAACDLPGRYANALLLKSVEFSFSMFCHNLSSYKMMKEKGEKDLLSGLYNRNRYETDLSLYPELYHTSLACVYIDVNGLHELNNSQGHEAGDRMLKTVAAQIRKTFGLRHAYRIGGDEFLVFALDMEEDTVCRLGKEMTEALKEKSIDISVGIQWETEVLSLEELIRGAEQKMYREKRAYYEQEAHDRRKRDRRQPS